jgi:hypothetical protein
MQYQPKEDTIFQMSCITMHYDTVFHVLGLLSESKMVFSYLKMNENCFTTFLCESQLT